jgi:hypothetical protein
VEKLDLRVRCPLYPESGQTGEGSICPLCAKSGLVQCSKKTPLVDHFVGADGRAAIVDNRARW